MLPCEIGMSLCPFRERHRSFCDASWQTERPARCPMVKDGSMLQEFLDSIDEEGGQ